MKGFKRPVRDPESYILASEAAKALASTALELAKSQGYVKFSITITYRSKEEIGAALARRKP
jgi:hypothetical protein